MRTRNYDGIRQLFQQFYGGDGPALPRVETGRTLPTGKPWEEHVRDTHFAFRERPRNPHASIQPFEHVNYAEIERQILGAKKN
jgi:hypothetical protein